MRASCQNVFAAVLKTTAEPAVQSGFTVLGA
jgi:hypothetical protein